MSDTFDSLRPCLETYLRDSGINPARRFRCLNPEHPDRHPSMHYDSRRHKVHCFSCEADYDLFDLLQLDLNLSSPAEALAEASRRYGTGSYAPSSAGTRQSTPSAPPRQTAEPVQETALPDNYIASCAAHRGETDYFARRGISEATAARFSLGYDPAEDCVVLPCDGGRVVRRSVGEKRYLNEKGVPSPLFQAHLIQPEGEPVFVVEGVFDALSAEELGCRACALNGSGNRTKLAELLRALPETAPVLLLPDADRAGDQWAEALTGEFPWLCRCPPLPEGKDLNELLCTDAAQAAAYLEASVQAWRDQLPPPYSATSAAGQLDALQAYIQAQAARPPLRTGFPRLDQALDGGLYDGLYVIGAVSSLGKTAFCMQVADQLAQQGRDVLIFSLEMMTYELMARSVSRETFQSDTSARRSMAKTVRGVLDGRRWPNYTAQESAHLQAAFDAYNGYADHLYFREGDHETGLDYIRAQVDRHIRETGRKPVVLIDYLQIIAPVDVHFTDKQNLDRIVCTLKKLSRERELTVLAISSFNRENYNLEVSMTAFKESGGIDYSADVLLGLQARGAGRPGFNVDAEKRRDPRELELKVLKNRSAALGEPIPFRYYPAFSCFEEGT